MTTSTITRPPHHPTHGGHHPKPAPVPMPDPDSNDPDGPDDGWPSDDLRRSKKAPHK
jgi:hypothetical protein